MGIVNKGGFSVLKCPYCGSEFTSELLYCPNCKQPLSRAGRSVERAAKEDPAERRAPRTRRQKWLIALIAVICVIALCLAVYKVFFWVSNYRVTRLYTRGKYTPTVSETTSENGLAAHTIAFYGEDGDQIFLPEMNKSLSISGGVARVTIPDADWFTDDVTDVESAKVCLSPVLIDETGIRTQLPALNLEIAVPDSPLEILSPAQDGVSIVTSRYQLELQVVYGSTVLVNGEDVTDMVSRSGVLSQNVNVYPVGDNVYTIVVQTPHHHETRKEVNIYRQTFDIDVDVDSSVSTVSQTNNVTIKGTVETGASISVETAYVTDSLILDGGTGEFKFIAKLSSYGDNTVRFRVTKEGKQDAVVNLTVEYKPTSDVYGDSCWAMDYNQLCKLYSQWNGQPFECKGTIEDIFTEDGISCLVMNVGTDDNPQLLILQNYSEVAQPVIGQKCRALADVSGRKMYDNQYYPMLAARFIYFLD